MEEDKNLRRIAAVGRTELAQELGPRMIGMETTSRYLGAKMPSGDMFFYCPEGGNASFQSMIISDLSGVGSRVLAADENGKLIISAAFVESSNVAVSDSSEESISGTAATQAIANEEFTDKINQNTDAIGALASASMRIDLLQAFQVGDSEANAVRVQFTIGVISSNVDVLDAVIDEGVDLDDYVVLKKIGVRYSTATQLTVQSLSQVDKILFINAYNQDDDIALDVPLTVAVEGGTGNITNLTLPIDITDSPSDDFGFYYKLWCTDSIGNPSGDMMVNAGSATLASAGSGAVTNPSSGDGNFNVSEGSGKFLPSNLSIDKAGDDIGALTTDLSSIVVGKRGVKWVGKLGVIIGSIRDDVFNFFQANIEELATKDLRITTTLESESKSFFGEKDETLDYAVVIGESLGTGFVFTSEPNPETANGLYTDTGQTQTGSPIYENANNEFLFRMQINAETYWAQNDTVLDGAINFNNVKYRNLTPDLVDVDTDDYTFIVGAANTIGIVTSSSESEKGLAAKRIIDYVNNSTAWFISKATAGSLVPKIYVEDTFFEKNNGAATGISTFENVYTIGASFIKALWTRTIYTDLSFVWGIGSSGLLLRLTNDDTTTTQFSFVQYGNDGSVTLPDTTIPSIESAGSKAATTKEYVDSTVGEVRFTVAVGATANITSTSTVPTNNCFEVTAGLNTDRYIANISFGSTKNYVPTFDDSSLLISIIPLTNGWGIQNNDTNEMEVTIKRVGNTDITQLTVV